MSCGNCEESSLAPGAGSRSNDVGSCAEDCQSLRVVEARWECRSDDNLVRCGDDVTMAAVVRGRGSRSGETVDFSVQHRHTGQTIDTAHDETRRHRAEAVWTAQKQCDARDDPEAFFTASAGGDSRDSGDLSFYRYPDFSEDAEIDGLETPRVELTFSEGELTLGVKVYLIPRTGGHPDAFNASLTHDDLAAIYATHDPVNATADPDTRQWAADIELWAVDMQNRIQAVFQDLWVLHRVNCRRGDDCDCPVSHGCCKFPLKVCPLLMHYSSYGGELDTIRIWNNPVHVANVWSNNGRDSTFDWYTGWSVADPCEGHRRGVRDDCAECQRLRAEGSANPCSRHASNYALQSCDACRGIRLDGQALILAHEIGHYLGFYDEYPQSAGGRIHPDALSVQGDFWQIEARGNLMGAGSGGSVGDNVPAYYFKPFADFFSQRMDDEFNLVPA